MRPCSVAESRFDVVAPQESACTSFGNAHSRRSLCWHLGDGQALPEQLDTVEESVRDMTQPELTEPESTQLELLEPELPGPDQSVQSPSAESKKKS